MSKCTNIMPKSGMSLAIRTQKKCFCSVHSSIHAFRRLCYVYEWWCPMMICVSNCINYTYTYNIRCVHMLIIIWFCKGSYGRLFDWLPISMHPASCYMPIEIYTCVLCKFLISNGLLLALFGYIVRSVFYEPIEIVMTNLYLLRVM